MEFRYRVTENGKRKLKSQIFDGAVYRTEKAVRQKIEAQLLRLNDGTEYARGQQVTFNALLDRYIDEEMPERHATKGGYVSIIERHLRPRWGAEPIMAIRPADLHAWFQSLKLAPVTKGTCEASCINCSTGDAVGIHAARTAQSRRYREDQECHQRVKEAVVLTPEQFRTIAPKLPGHVNMIAITAACLGLRVSEALGLQWGDIDWELQTVTIRRSAYRGAIDDTKNAGSKANCRCIPHWRSCCSHGNKSARRNGSSPIL